MKNILWSTALLLTLINCGSPSSSRSSTENEDSALQAIVDADAILLKKPRSADAIKNELDTDDDDKVSKEEMKAGLDNLGQKVKAAIAAKNEELKAAHDAAKAKIKDACEDDRGSEECRAVAREEKDKLSETREKALADLQVELDALKDLLVTVETENATLS